MNEADFMREALAEAQLALGAGELPVGCVIACEGEIIARAHNETEALRDPTAHAELLAIRRAAGALGDWRLNRCTLYVTLEPCPMCAGALVEGRMGRLVFGAPNPAQGCAGSLYRIPEDPVFPHFCPSDGGWMAEACRAPLRRFFGKVRSDAEDAGKEQ